MFFCIAGVSVEDVPVDSGVTTQILLASPVTKIWGYMTGYT